MWASVLSAVRRKNKKDNWVSAPEGLTTYVVIRDRQTHTHTH